MNPKKDFFRNNVCYTCKKLTGKLTKRCSQCKVVSYCSKEHQQENWKDHRTLCKIISNENQFLVYKVTNYEELLIYKQQRGLYWQLKLGRKLTKAESQMFMFPRVCAVCFKREPLFDCIECWSEFYCSKEHKEQHKNFHKRFCKDLKLTLDMECYFYHNGLHENAFAVKKVEDGIASISHTSKFLSHVVESWVPTTELNYLQSCDQVLSGITILFALEISGLLLKCVLPKPILNIHIVGATAFEYSLDWALIYEIFFHWIKNLETINIAFIGPEILNFTSNFNNMKAHFCQECRSRFNLIVNEKLYKCLYHEKIRELEKPDVIIAFNSGFHEFSQSNKDTWRNSLESLISFPEVPLVITSYTYDEMLQDLGRLKEVAKIEVLYGPLKNPFANQRPFQDWASKDNPIYFINNFLSVVKKAVSL